MHLLALALLVTGCVRTGSHGSFDTGRASTEHYCDTHVCGGSGEALGIGLVGLGVLVGFATLREILY